MAATTVQVAKISGVVPANYSHNSLRTDCLEDLFRRLRVGCIDNHTNDFAEAPGLLQAFLLFPAGIAATFFEAVVAQGMSPLPDGSPLLFRSICFD